VEYSIQLDRKQFLSVAIIHLGLVLDISIVGPNGLTLKEIRGSPEAKTLISVIAPLTGTYRLLLSSRNEDGGAKNMKLQIDVIRPAAPTDTKRISAADAFAEAESLQRGGNSESCSSAIDKYEVALQVWRQTGDKREEASALRNIGRCHYLLGDPTKALDNATQALKISRGIGDGWGAAIALNDMVYASIAIGELEHTDVHLDEALRLSSEAGNRRAEAQALHNRGEVRYEKGELRKSLPLFEQALSIWRDLGEVRGEALTVLNMGYSYADLDRISEAMKAYQNASELWCRAEDTRGEARTILTMIQLAYKTGEHRRAIELYQESRQLFEELGDPILQSLLLGHMGTLYRLMNANKTAVDYFSQAMEIMEAADTRINQAYVSAELGQSYLAMGECLSAREKLNQALAVIRKLGDKRVSARILERIGDTFGCTAQEDEALKLYHEALETSLEAQDLRGQAEIQNRLGSVYLRRRDLNQAASYFNRALQISQLLKDSIGESWAMSNLARLEQRQGNYTAAIEQIAAAVQIIESQRTKVPSRELRSSYFASVHAYYELYVDLLMAGHRERPSLGLDADALHVSERSRARSLMELLAETPSDIQKGIDPELRERERELQSALNAKAQAQMRLAAGKHTQQELGAMAKEIRSLNSEYDLIQTQIRLQNPRFAALTQPQPLTHKAIKSLLEPDTLLLEYYLGEEKSFVWAIGRDSLTSYELPPRDVIESSARRLRNLLIVRQRTNPEQSAKLRRDLILESDAGYWSEAAKLSQILLGPLSEAPKIARLVIVPDEILQYIPFSALVSSQSRALEVKDAAAEDSMRPLILDYEITVMPSASALALLRQDAEGRNAAEKMIAVIADPVFEKDDPRLMDASKDRRKIAPSPKSDASRGYAEASSLQYALRDLGSEGGGLRLSRLLATGREKDTIMAQVPPAEGKALVGFDASRERVTSGELRRYRIVHFATHGFINDAHPNLSGIVLSLLGKEGESRDGFLRLHDIYSLDLAADLVVLSACNTAIGRDIQGEGLVSIVRGFMYAGALRVVSSLWKVQDESTAELMKNFYKYMFQDSMTPAAALRAAQIDMWKSKRWSAPYYWAPFILQGEWR